jgi:hypothetical protein
MRNPPGAGGLLLRNTLAAHLGWPRLAKDAPERLIFVSGWVDRQGSPIEVRSSSYAQNYTTTMRLILPKTDRPFRVHFTNMDYDRHILGVITGKRPERAPWCQTSPRSPRSAFPRLDCALQVNGPRERPQHDFDAAIRPIHSRQHDGGARVGLPKAAAGQGQSGNTKVCRRRNLGGVPEGADISWRTGECRSQDCK